MFKYYVYFIIISLICKLGCAFDSTAQTHEDVLAFILNTNSGHLSTEAKLSQATSNIPRIGCIMSKF